MVTERGRYYFLKYFLFSYVLKIFFLISIYQNNLKIKKIKNKKLLKIRLNGDTTSFGCSF